MDFITYITTWSKSEVLQGRIMIGLGCLTLIALIFIFSAGNSFLKGALIPLGLLVLILIGYGGYILSSRPAHAKESISKFETSKTEAIELEKTKHINDNKLGKTLLKVYPLLMIISILFLYFVSSPYYKGMAIGFALLFVSTYIIDNGFISRSDDFLAFLDKLT